MIQDIISILTLLGIGGILGAFIKSFLETKKELELKNQKIKEEKYRSILGFMRCVINPDSLKDHMITEDAVRAFKLPQKTIYELKGEELKKRLIQLIEGSYFHSMLYAPDSVLLSIKKFIVNPNNDNFMKTAIEMRKDLWKKKTKLKISMLSLK